ncbi:MAG TPA: hypothetical protein VK576_03450 [Thermoleophilia bacterium]|nr:hypothetical protein [Thermoleophilia bacterium]
MTPSDSSLLRGCRTSAGFCAGCALVVATLCLRDYLRPGGTFTLAPDHVSLLAVAGYLIVVVGCVLVVVEAFRRLSLRTWAWTTAVAGSCVVIVALAFAARLATGDGGLHARVTPLTNGPMAVAPGVALPDPIADWRGDLRSWITAILALALIELASVAVAVIGRRRRAFGEQA